MKDLTEAGHHVHLGKVKAYTGVEGNIVVGAAAKKVVTQKIIDAGGGVAQRQEMARWQQPGKTYESGVFGSKAPFPSPRCLPGWCSG